MVVHAVEAYVMAGILNSVSFARGRRCACHG